MSPYIRWICFVGLMGWPVAAGLANDPKAKVKVEAKPKVEVPSGYEQASKAGQAAARKEAAARKAAAARKEAIIKAARDPAVLKKQADANKKAEARILHIEKQYLRHFQPLMKAERSFILRACGLTKAQRKEIAKAGENCLKAAVRKFAVAQVQKQGGRALLRQGGGMVFLQVDGRVIVDARAGATGRRTTMPDPRTLIQEEFSQVVKEKLRPEQAARYQEEIEKRTANRRRVVILNLVAKLDEHLMLSPEQRQKLMESLSTNWKQSWTHSLQMLRHNNQHLPNIPKQLVVPLLSKSQQAVWHGIPKYGFSSGGGFFFSSRGAYNVAGNRVEVEDNFDQ